MAATSKARSRTGSANGKSGLTVASFRGLNKKRMERRGGGGSKNFGKRLILRPGDTCPVQFLEAPEDMREFDIHSFREQGKWVYVPCLGDKCPLCDDEDNDRSKVKYRFVCNVYNLKEKKVQLLEGPADLSSRISYRAERKPTMFLKRTFDVTKFNGSPVTYDVAPGDEDAVPTGKLQLFDLDEYIIEEARNYYGDDMPTGKSALEADDDIDDELDDVDDEEDEDVTEDAEKDEDSLRDELEDLTPAKLKARAKANGAKVAEYKNLDNDELIDFIVSQEIGSDEDDDEDEDLDLEDEDLDDDEDDDDEDEEDDDDLDDDDDEEDDEPPAKSKSSARKAPPRKSAAKKTTSRKR